MNVLRSLRLAALPLLAAAAHATPPDAPCPARLPRGAHCHLLQDAEGAWVWVALPAGWTRDDGVLVVHAHGGPTLGPPAPKRGEDDLQRWAVMVKAGYAWVGSTYRRGGYGVRSAAEDTERARTLFVEHFGAPRGTVLHGQSWGGNVAAKAAELFPRSWDGVLLTSGVLGGGTHSYDARLDLRVVYQYVCKNHPLPDEPQYPLWQGLPSGSPLTRAELARRVDACTGVRQPAEARSARQRANLAVILAAVKIPERSLIAHLDWATWLFQDLVQERLGGRNPFGNDGAHYSGPEEAALNAGVLRYRADPQAVAQLAEDSDLSGRVTLPTLTLHAVDDPTAIVELESVYRETRERAGTADRLVQVFSDEHEHSYLSDPQYPALMSALLAWIERDAKPTPQRVAELCRGYEAAYGKACKLLPDYRPAPLSARVPPRDH